MQVFCRGTGQIEIPVGEKWIAGVSEERSADILSKDAPIFIFVCEVLRESRTQLVFPRMRADTNYSLSVMGLLSIFE